MIDNTILDDSTSTFPLYDGSVYTHLRACTRVRTAPWCMVRSLARNRTMTQKTHGHMRESKSPYASSLLHRAHLAANPSTPRLRERRDSARLDGPRRLILQCPRGVMEGQATRRQLSMSQIELRTQTRDSGLRERARGEPLEFRYSESERAGRATRDSSRCSPHCHTLRSSGRA